MRSVVKKLAWLTVAVAIVLVAILSMTVGAEQPAPTLAIKGFNVSLRDAVCLKYGVAAENAGEVKLLIWTEPQNNYVLGTQKTELTSVGASGGMLVFDYTGLAAKQMTDVIYSRAYTEVDGEIYYSDVRSYSVLEYLYTQLGYIGNKPTPDPELISLIEVMMEYGAAAQKFLDYNTDRLATDKYYQVTVEGGVLPDGMTSGLYKEGDVVTLKPEEDGNLSHWVDNNDNEYTTEITVGNSNVTFEPVYEAVCDVWDGTADTSWYNTTDKEFVIYTAEQLAGLAQLTNAGNTFEGITIKLGSNIDLNGINDKQWIPIGDEYYFTGTFDGCGYVVKNMKITGQYTSDDDIQKYVGLFGDSKGTLQNIGVENVNIDVSVISTSTTSYSYAGGLVGINSGTISNSYVTGDVSSSSNWSDISSYSYAGGLVGINRGDISNSYAVGGVSSTSTGANSSFSYAGGLVGDSNGDIINSYATSDVTSTAPNGHSYAGGFVGYNRYGTISNSYAMGGNVTSSDYRSYAGGLVGYNYYGTISDSYATDIVTNNLYTGGLVGYNDWGDIINSYATGDVSSSSSSGGSYAGGLVGFNNYGSISNSYAMSNVNSASSNRGNSYSYAGGFVGYNKYGIISNSYATGNVSSVAISTSAGYRSEIYSYVGGLVGYNYGTITNSYATGNINSKASSPKYNSNCYVGGLVGVNYYDVSNSYRYCEQSFTIIRDGDVAHSVNSIGIATSLQNLQSAEWVKQNLWEEIDIWNFNKGYPTLNYDYINNHTIQISTPDQLLKLQGQYLGFNYELTNDIDLKGAEWNPIVCLVGTFNGNGHTISNFKIVPTNKIQVGFFGENQGNLQNIGIDNFTVNISSTVYSVGSLVGFNNKGTVINCYSMGNVSVSSEIFFRDGTNSEDNSGSVGGLVGVNSGSIYNSYAVGNVSAISSIIPYNGINYGDSLSDAGGLVGANSGSIYNSYAVGKISAISSISPSDGIYYNYGDSFSYAGGLVGYNTGTISNSYATGDVVGTSSNIDDNAANSEVGGLVGYSNGDVSNSYATGDVSSNSSSNSSSSSGFSSSHAGGLVGRNYGTISNNYRYIGQTFTVTKNGTTTYEPINTEGTAADFAKLQSVDFHTTTLGWDTSVWNIVEGSHPTLKIK